MSWVDLVFKWDLWGIPLTIFIVVIYHYWKVHPIKIDMEIFQDKIDSKVHNFQDKIEDKMKFTETNVGVKLESLSNEVHSLSEDINKLEDKIERLFDKLIPQK